MKVGDYVRTKDYQNIRSRIGKIIKQDGKYYYLDVDEDTQMVWEEDTVLKSSPNIIELIEVGDLVNYEQLNGGYVLNKKENEIDTWAILPNSLKNEDIKSVITREQLRAIQYNLESEVK